MDEKKNNKRMFSARSQDLGTIRERESAGSRQGGLWGPCGVRM